ncbi:MAG: 50S ribosomal protein L5 [Candidatus Berkelbacteria bacterium]|nr:50S ribosomal protein L5 [Candidatus Berkelbacteria bacterium]
MPSRLLEKYNSEIVEGFLKEGYKNKMAVPKVTKVTVNVGIGKNRGNEKFVADVTSNLQKITGQKPAIRKAKKAISGFKVRIGDSVGLVVTLRGVRMYDFLDKLANITLPRLRDFRGLDQKSFDKNNNFTLGIKEHLVFPEVTHSVDNIHGLEISIATTAKNQKDAIKLIKEIGFPFRKENTDNSQIKNG